MEFLSGNEMYNYFVDMIFVQVYASQNRKLIMQKILEILKTHELDVIESTHNYIDFEDMIFRKGAISSYSGKRMIIPFNMADGILICEGKSNKEWIYSAPHGAGRILSRTKAFESLNVEKFEKIIKRETFTQHLSQKQLSMNHRWHTSQPKKLKMQYRILQKFCSK